VGVSRRGSFLRAQFIPVLVGLIVATLLSLVPIGTALTSSAGFVGSATLPGNDGFWLVTPWGDVNNYGAAKHYGDILDKKKEPAHAPAA